MSLSIMLISCICKCLAPIALISYNKVTTVNSRYNQVGYNELSGYNEVVFGPLVALLMQITSVITNYPVITKSWSEGSDITRVDCMYFLLMRDYIGQQIPALYIIPMKNHISNGRLEM